MKKIATYAILISAFLISCSKKDDKCNFNDSPKVAPQTEIDNVHNYLSSNGINADLAPSGFFYKIISQGSGQAVVNLCSNVTVKYKGRLTNGTIFDSTATGQTAIFQLGQVIVGWQKGIPLVSSGGRIALFLPPSLGYGPSGSGPIPPNSILVFDVELVGVV